jgi:hypothetical protein
MFCQVQCVCGGRGKGWSGGGGGEGVDIFGPTLFLTFMSTAWKQLQKQVQNFIRQRRFHWTHDDGLLSSSLYLCELERKTLLKKGDCKIF